MLIEVLKAILVGILASAPIGPVAILVMQKTFCHGRNTGFVAGIGSAVVDTLYALVSLFALALIENFFTRNEALIMIIGGAVVVLVAFFMSRGNSFRGVKADASKRTMAGYAVQAAGCALANPGALAFMLALVAIVGLNVKDTVLPVWAVVLFVFIGALIWWMSFAYAVDKLRANISAKSLVKVNTIAAILVLVFGLALVVRGIILLF